MVCGRQIVRDQSSELAFRSNRDVFCYAVVLFLEDAHVYEC